MEWTEHFNGWQEAIGKPESDAHLRMEAARKRVHTNTSEDWQWLAKSLAHPKQKVFVALVFKRQPVPKRLLAPFLHAAVMEHDPSRNRLYIEPCIRSWGDREVNQRLLRYLETGSNEEKAGVASAFYWARRNPRNEDTASLNALIRSALLREFVCNEDLSVRQRIAPLLNLDTSAYAIEDRQLISEAIEIARRHTDQYIRHRIEIQMGAGDPFMAIPRIQ